MRKFESNGNGRRAVVTSYELEGTTIQRYGMGAWAKASGVPIPVASFERGEELARHWVATGLDA